MKARLEAHGANIMEQTLPAIGLHQLFAESPEGVRVELIFELEDYQRGVAQRGQAG